MLRLSPLFGPGAVLCRDQVIRVFGWSDQPEVRVRLLDGQGKLLAQDLCPVREGRFLAFLAPQKAALGCLLTAQAGQETVLSENILIGDVYLASGQSNMELEFQNADEGRQLIPIHQNDQVRYFNVPKIAVPGPDNDAALEAIRWTPVAPNHAGDMSAVAYFFAMKMEKKLQVPVGIIDCYWGGTSITCWMKQETLNLSREGQKYLSDYKKLSGGKTMEQYKAEEEIAFAKMRAWDEAAAPHREKNPLITGPELEKIIGPYPWKTPDGPGSPYRPSGLYESMTSHLIPAALTGVLYYQGEEDTWRTDHYDILLTDFVRMLRQDFRNDQLPFLNVQLPMWNEDGREDSFTWPRLRLAQEKACRLLRNSSLTCLIDQGEYNSIHPTNKRVVGERLADNALSMIYGKEAPLPPQAVEAVPLDGKLVIRLSAPVCLRDTDNNLLEIAGQDGVFVPADLWEEEDRLILSSPSLPRPISARYAWTDYAQVPLFGENGLPLMPFWVNA